MSSKPHYSPKWGVRNPQLGNNDALREQLTELITQHTEVQLAAQKQLIEDALGCTISDAVNVLHGEQ